MTRTSSRPRQATRREALRLLGMGAGLALAAACGPPTLPSATPGGGTAPTRDHQPARQQAPATTGGPVTVRVVFWGDSDDDSNFWGNLAVAAGQVVGNVQVQLSTIGSGSYWSRLPALLVAADGPDIIGLQSERAPAFLSRRLFRPLDDLLQGDPSFDLADVEPLALDGLAYDGVRYGLPLDVRPTIACLNTTLFERAGLSLPHPDWTWDDLVTTARRLTGPVDGIEIFGTALSTAFARAVPFIFSNGGDYANLDFTRSTLRAPETVEALQFYADLRHRHGVAAPLAEPPRTIAPAPSTADREAFLAGRAAIFLGGASELPHLRAGMRDAWDVMSVPRGKAGAVSAATVSGMGISAGTRQPEASWTVLKALTGPASLRQLAVSGRGYPARASALAGMPPAAGPPGMPPRFREVVRDQLKSARLLRANPTWQEIVTQLDGMLMAPILVEGRPILEAVQAVEPVYQLLIDRARRQPGRLS